MPSDGGAINQLKTGKGDNSKTTGSQTNREKGDERNASNVQKNFQGSDRG